MQAPERVVTLRYTEPLLRRAAWALWRRAVGWWGGLGYLLLTVCLGYELVRGDRSWETGAMGTAFVMATAFGIAVYRVQLGRSLAKLRRMQEPAATFEMSGDSFRVVSDTGSFELPWNTISEVWRLPELWLLFSSRRYYMTFPLAAVDAQTQQLILERFRSAGAKII